MANAGSKSATVAAGKTSGKAATPAAGAGIFATEVVVMPPTGEAMVELPVSAQARMRRSRSESRRNEAGPDCTAAWPN